MLLKRRNALFVLLYMNRKYFLPAGTPKVGDSDTQISTITLHVASMVPHNRSAVGVIRFVDFERGFACFHLYFFDLEIVHCLLQGHRFALKYGEVRFLVQHDGPRASCSCADMFALMLVLSGLLGHNSGFLFAFLRP